MVLPAGCGSAGDDSLEARGNPGSPEGEPGDSEADVAGSARGAAGAGGVNDLLIYHILLRLYGLLLIALSVALGFIASFPWLGMLSNEPTIQLVLLAGPLSAVGYAIALVGAGFGLWLAATAAR